MTTAMQLAQVRRLTRSGVARRRRIAARLSLAEIAAEIGVAPSTVFRWEKNKRTPRGDAAVAYLRVLDEIAPMAGRP